LIEFAITRPLKGLAFFCVFILKKQNKKLLPRKVFEGVALTQKLSNIRPKVSQESIKGLKRLTNKSTKVALISLILFFLSGYYPAFSFPPTIKQPKVYASSQVQEQEIIASYFSQPIILPHPGYLSTRFSTWHPGIDIATGLGMPIHPITSGTVEETGASLWGLGNYVEVSHENGFKSKYAHMGKVYVKKDQKITTENILGEVGLTGRTSGPHTHLEVTRNGQFIDPQTILPEIPDMPKVEHIKK